MAGDGAGDIDYQIDITNPTPPPDGDIIYGEMKFLRNKNPNGLKPELVQETDGPSLRLAVVQGGYTAISSDDATRNDRCELRDAKLRLGTPVWYSFELRADSEFPVVDARCVCAQVKAPYYDANGGSPLFALRIDRGRYLATVEHLYEIKDVDFVNGSEVSRHVKPYAGADTPGARALDHHVFGNTAQDFKELQVRAVLATDAGGLQTHLDDEFRWSTDLVRVSCERTLPDEIDRWWRFTVRVAPTQQKDEDGILQLLVGEPGSPVDQLVATAIGEFGHVGYDGPNNDGPPPDQAHQYFKIGPYRDKIRLWGDRPAAIYVRNIRRGPWAEGAVLRDQLRA